MKIFTTITEIRAYITNHIGFHTIGFVPTMGALHDGHLSLIQQSKKENDITVCSIFVNPIQFNNTIDLEKYPKTLDEDKALLNSAGCDAIFAPSIEEMYSEKPLLKIHFGHLESIMEGKNRPGHFNGVGIIVSKLFNIINPNNAYFGQKDFQQLAIVRQLVRDFSFAINIISCPIIREENGLAMSSRNKRLSPQGLSDASCIFQSLQKAKTLIATTPIKECKKTLHKHYKTIKNVDLEYFEIVDKNSLIEVNDKSNHVAITLCIAVVVEGVRLIDNIVLMRDEDY